MKKKVIVIIIAIVAIVLVLAIGFGKQLFEEYSYSKEEADLSEYFGLSDGEMAIVLQNDTLVSKAIKEGEEVYIPLDTVNEKIGEGFYYDPSYNSGTLMFTTADGTYETAPGSSACTLEGIEENLGYVASTVKDGELYVSTKYISRFMQASFEVYDKHIRVATTGGDFDAREVSSDTQIRVEGDKASPFIREVKEGETVELVEAMDEWSRVVTSDGFTGFIENKRLKDAGAGSYEAALAPDISETAFNLLGERVVLGFNSIAGLSGNDTVYGALDEAKGMNVIAPTWFSVTGGDGSIRNLGSSSYVQTAHSNGVKVWAVADDFNYRNESGDTSFNDLDFLSNTVSRRNLENNLVNACVALGVDGLNIDFEKLYTECGVHYAQFIKELSVLTHKNGLVLSTDNYVPFSYNEFYRLDVQGGFVDYVLIMGYDEHYHGSGDIGSVASFDYVCSGMDKTMQYVAPERIINAVPFYTIVWKDEGSTISDSYLTLVNQAEYISKYNISYEWDEATCQNYAEWKSGTTTYHVWFEDSESLTAKLNAMNTRNIGGVGVWRIGYGTPEVWNLIGMYKNMKTESTN
ncbi:MAG: chitinase [Lachnospiraceae bacterium]|nr:chitinase [Lachnospiraceae bacterium]